MWQGVLCCLAIKGINSLEKSEHSQLKIGNNKTKISTFSIGKLFIAQLLKKKVKHFVSYMHSLSAYI